MHDEKNIYDNQVAEKAVWEESCTDEGSYIDAGRFDSPVHNKSKNEYVAEVVELLQSPTRNVVSAVSSNSNIPSIAAKIEAQPQMMFCYKCNNVIPNDSKFCPYCQIELFVICPKCGVKYSSQYPACNQCGTNRIEYLQIEKERQERKKKERQKRLERLEKERIEREEREARERIEREERETRERIEREERKRIEREEKQRELAAYKAENERIKETEEYKNTYSLLTKAQGALKRHNFIIKIEKSLYSILITTIKIIISILYTPIFLVFCILGCFIFFSIMWLIGNIVEYISEITGLNAEMLLILVIIIAVFVGGTVFSYKTRESLNDFFGSCMGFIAYPYEWLWKDGRWKKEEIWKELEDRKKRLFLIKYISKRSNYYHKTIPFLVENYIKKDDLTNCCINAYRKKHGLPIK